MKCNICVWWDDPEHDEDGKEWGECWKIYDGIEIETDAYGVVECIKTREDYGCTFHREVLR